MPQALDQVTRHGVGDEGHKDDKLFVELKMLVSERKKKKKQIKVNLPI